MPHSKTGRKKSPKRILALPDLEHAKTAVLNSLTSASGQRTYEHAIGAPARDYVIWPVANSIRFSSSWGTFRFRRRNATWDNEQRRCVQQPARPALTTGGLQSAGSDW